MGIENESGAGRVATGALLAGMLAVAAPAMAEAPVGEAAVFAEAARYTVRIRSSAQVGLGLDETGAWFGAGFLVDRARGWILTNGHVSGRSPGAITVTFKGGPALPARRVFVDTHLDLAVVAVAPERVPEGAFDARLDCAASAVAGTPVGAFGHPWSLPFTATRGIVSAQQYLEGQESLQTDAPLNPGNSGGPLISLVTGRVVGISQATMRTDKQRAEGIGFAVPAPYACRVLALMAAGRDPAAPTLDVAFAETEEPGVIVVAQPLSARWSALQPGDRILAVEGEGAIDNPTALVHALRGRAGPATFSVERAGDRLSVVVTPRFDPPVLERPAILFGGIAVVEPWRLDGASDADGPPPGLVIDDVGKASMASAKGLKAAQTLVRVDGHPVTSLEALWRLLARAPRPESVTLLVREWSKDPLRLYGYRQITLDLDGLSRVRGDRRVADDTATLAAEGGR